MPFCTFLSCKRRPAVVKYFIIAGSMAARRSVPMKEFVFLCIILITRRRPACCPKQPKRPFTRCARSSAIRPACTAWVWRPRICSRTAAGRSRLRSAVCPRKYISPLAARRAPTSACAVPLTSTDIKGPHHHDRDRARGNRQHRKAACCGRLRRSFPCTGRNRSHHARGADRSTDRGHHSSLLPAGQQRDRHGTAGRTARKAAQGQGTQGAVPY